MPRAVRGAVRLRVQSDDRLCGPAVVRACGVLRHGRLRGRLDHEVLAHRCHSRIALGGVTGAVLGLCLGYLAIRRSGIYFAMITLALAQMVYFVCLEAPFTGGEDGIQQVPGAICSGSSI